MDDNKVMSITELPSCHHHNKSGVDFKVHNIWQVVTDSSLQMWFSLHSHYIMTVLSMCMHVCSNKNTKWPRVWLSQTHV